MFLFSTLLMEAPETSGKENKKSMTPEEHVSHYAQRKAAGARPAELKKLEHEAFKAFYSSSNEWKDYIAKMKVSDIAKQDAANFGFAQTKEGYLELSFTRTLRSITELREYLAKHPQNQLKAADLTPEIEQFIVRDFTKKSFKYGRVGYLRAKEGMTLEDIFNNVFDNYIQSIGGKEKYDPTQLDVVRQLAKDRVLSSLPQNAKKTLMSINREFQGYNHPESALFAIVAGAKDLYQRIKSSMENIMSTYKFPPIQTTPSIPSIQALPETSFSPKLDLVPKSTFNVSAETSAIEALSHTTNGFDNKQVVDNLMNFRLHKMNDLTKFFNEMKATGGKFTLVDENGNQKSFVLSDIIRDRDATGARRDFLLFIRNFKLERQNEMTITLGKNEYILKVDRKESGGTITLDTLKGQKIKFFASADNKTGIATATLDVPGFSIVADAKYYYDNAKRFTVENVNTTFNVGKQAILSISGTSLNFTPSQIFTFNKNDPFKSTITIGGDNPSALARKTISLQQLVGNDPQTAALRRQAWAAIVNNLGENAMISIGATIGSAQTKITAGVDISKDNLQHGYQRIRGPGRVGASLTLAGVNVGVANVANLSVENSTFTYYTGSGGTYAGWSDASGNELMGVSSSITKKELNDAGISKVIETAHKLKDQIELAWKSGNIKQMKTDWVKARDNILHNLWNVYDALPEDTNLRISLSNLLPHVQASTTFGGLVSQVGESMSKYQDETLVLTKADMKELYGILKEGSEVSKRKYPNDDAGRMQRWHHMEMVHKKAFDFFTKQATGISNSEDYVNLLMANYAGLEKNEFEKLNTGVTVAAKTLYDNYLKQTQAGASAKFTLVGDDSNATELYGKLMYEQTGFNPFLKPAAKSDLLLSVQSITAGVGVKFTNNNVGDYGINLDYGAFGQVMVPLGKIGLSYDNDKAFIPLFSTGGKSADGGLGDPKLFGYAFIDASAAFGAGGEIKVSTLISGGKVERFGLNELERGVKPVLNEEIIAKSPMFDVGIGLVQLSGNVRALDVGKQNDMSYRGQADVLTGLGTFSTFFNQGRTGGTLGAGYSGNFGPIGLDRLKFSLGAEALNTKFPQVRAGLSYTF